MMLHMDGDDMLSLSMFWAGALMVFTPLIGASIGLGVWWRQRGKPRVRRAPGLPLNGAIADQRGTTAEPHPVIPRERA
jgi:hypothetical protein